MSAPPPLPFRWTGTVMEPLRQRAAAREYIVGSIYSLEHREDRSSASHAHYFSCIADVWANLPDRLAEQFPDPEKLRKYALCMTGYRDERSFVCSSRAEALRLAGFIKPMDDYAIVSVSEAVVVVWTARSQSYRAMGKTAFNESKQKVLDFLAGLIGTPVGELGRAA